MVESGESIQQETRLWDSREQRTYGMRSKEFAHDYRYFPEPDLLPLVITEEWKEEVRRSLPELPQSREERFATTHGLPRQDATLLTVTRTMAEFFEEVVKGGAEPKLAANWLLNEYSFLLEEAKVGFTDFPVACGGFRQAFDAGWAENHLRHDGEGSPAET